MTRIILLTGPKRKGKTTACQRFVEKGHQADIQMGGILTPARYDQAGVKKVIDVIDVATGHQRVLANIASNPEQATVGEYRFRSKTTHWALERVLSALAAPLDVVIIDEIGPLELEQKRGFAPALERLPTSPAQIVILIARRSLACQVQGKLAELQPKIVRLCKTNRNQIPARLYTIVHDMLSTFKDR